MNEANNKVLWPELFTYKRLGEIRRDIGEKAFNREYQCSPVWSEDTYFRRDELMITVDAEERKDPGGSRK